MTDYDKRFYEWVKTYLKEDPELMHSGHLAALEKCWEKGKEIGWDEAMMLVKVRLRHMESRLER
jgi:hypothetical protein